MWELYRSTFLRMQILIGLVTAVVFFMTGHRIPAATVFFTVMQIGAVLGAMWGIRLRNRLGIHR